MGSLSMSIPYRLALRSGSTAQPGHDYSMKSPLGGVAHVTRMSKLIASRIDAFESRDRGLRKRRLLDVLLGAVLLWLALLAGSGQAVAQVVENHTFTNLNRRVPDGNGAGLSDMRSVLSSIAVISAVRVKLNVEGEFNGDLYGYLRHIRGGTTNFCVLINRPGRASASLAGYGDSGLNITLDDSVAGADIHTYRSVTNLPAGVPLLGTWRTDGRVIDPGVVLDTTPRTTAPLPSPKHLLSFRKNPRPQNRTLHAHSPRSKVSFHRKLEPAGSFQQIQNTPPPKFGTRIDQTRLSITL